MKKKLIMKVLFEKRKILVFFLLMCMFLIIYTSLQTVLLTSDRAAVASMPDFVFSGTVYQSEDGTYPFIGYNDIGGFADRAAEIAGDRADCYPVVYRSLYNYYDELTSIGFYGAVYGMSDKCIEQNIAGYLDQGALPADGKKEAVVGYYFAQRFHLALGDPIPQAITLSKEWTDDDLDQYVISGILKESISDYFNGSAIISRDTFEKLNGPVEDNMLMGYYRTGEDYDTVFLSMNAEGPDYQVPEGKLNYKQKEFSQTKLLLNIAIVVLMSVFLLTAIVSYLMKGITPKVGLIKAIGVSTSYIISTFLSGILAVFVAALGGAVTLSYVIMYLMNNYVSKFYQFEVHSYRLTGMALLLDLFEFIFILVYVFLVTYMKCKMISPKEAMAKTI